MKRDKAIVFGSLMFCMAAASGLAEDVTVTGRLRLTSDGCFTTRTKAATSEPELPTPLFHFDVRRTNDWVWYNAAKTRVTKIPSLAGARYLKGGDGVSGANGIDGGNWATIKKTIPMVDFVLPWISHIAFSFIPTVVICLAGEVAV